jgi:hypothetical protein
MSIIYQVFQKASSDPEKNARETFSPNAGQRSRAVIPATIQGQQPPEQRGFYARPAFVISDSTTGNADVHHLTR